MPKRSIRFLLSVLFGYLLSISLVLASASLTSMDYFFNQVKTFEARFGQIILDESLNSVATDSGTVWIQRPGLFRWDYDPPEEQQIVADSNNVWVYDVELEQVTVHSQQDALGKSPAAILSGDGNLEDNYSIEDIGTQGRYDWINLIAKSKDSNFRELRLGFENNQLRLLELIDNLDQRTRVNFVDLKENQPISSERFYFRVPDGVDLIDNTQR